MSTFNIKNKNHPENDGFKLGNELIGLFSIFIGLLFILSLATFDYRDPWLNHVVSGQAVVHNKAGLFGAYAGGLLLDLCGYGAWIVPGLFCFIGARRILGASAWPWWRWTGVCLLFVVISFVGAARDIALVQQVAGAATNIVTNHSGGILGHAIYGGLVSWLSHTGAWLIWTLCLLLSIQVMVGFSWLAVVAQFAAFLIQTSTKMAEDLIKERHEKKHNKPIPLESDASRPNHFSLPASLFGKSQSGSGGQSSSSGMPISSMALENANDSPMNSPNSLARDSAYSSGDVPGGLPGDLPGDLPGEFLFSENIEEESTEKKGFFQSFFSAPKRNDSDSPQELPPWIDAFEQGPHESFQGSSSDESLRPDFSTVQESTQTKTPPSGEQDALLTILESYESSLQDNKASDSQPFAMPILTDKALETETSEPESSEPGTPQASPVPTLPAQGLFMPDGSNNATSAQEIHTSSAQPATSTEQASPIPIRDKAPDSVLEALSAQENAQETTVRKKARLPLPPLDLLEAIPQSDSKTPYSVLESKAHDLMTCLNDFGIQGELVGITPGPVVTMFEVRPAPGVRVARIANLSDDLALALKAVAVRIQAPVPGTDTVGVEVPNEAREVVCLRQILSSDTFQKSKSLLSIALGKDIAGHPTVADLATMPHLLVAGATGAGKSVGINSIILSLLYKATPDEVRLLLVDPKRVEMAIYSDLPHLVHPVVTEMQLAKNALEWAVREMDDRYSILAQAQVRNITDYNAKLKEHSKKPVPEMEGMDPMPYLVIIIDELADLMLTAAKEVETSIVRLAQLARAAGIHLILATQRPSVDVVTGIIKANFPCRIAFQVTSKHDSRTILDSVGAEHLLGKGDMLFKPSGGRFQRMHGAFVDDKNVKRVVEYWKKLQKPQFDVDFAEMESSSSEALGNGGNDIYDDPVYSEAVEFVCQQGKASISLIQRRFRIGFNKAARIIEQMEADGIVGPQEGSKPRAVLR